MSKKKGLIYILISLLFDLLIFISLMKYGFESILENIFLSCMGTVCFLIMFLTGLLNKKIREQVELNRISFFINSLVFIIVIVFFIIYKNCYLLVAANFIGQAVFSFIALKNMCKINNVELNQEK